MIRVNKQRGAFSTAVAGTIRITRGELRWMQNITGILLALGMLLVLSGCSDGSFKKTKSGLVYKVVSDGKNPVAKVGQFIKVHYSQKVERAGSDTTLSSSFNAMPTYAPVDSIGDVYNPAEIFSQLRKGDSAIVVMSADSLEKKQGMLPPFISKSDKLVLTLKVLDVLDSEDEVRKDQEALVEAQKVNEVKEIEKYLADNNIKAQKTDKGVFVVIDQKGDGPAVDTGKAVHVMYRGTTFAGQEFDSNLDSTFGHTDPFVLVIGKRGAIEGWDDGLRLFNKGGKGKLYIPSMLAYGPNPPPGAPFKAFENLIFDVEVVDVTAPK